MEAVRFDSRGSRDCSLADRLRKPRLEAHPHLDLKLTLSFSRRFLLDDPRILAETLPPWGLTVPTLGMQPRHALRRMQAQVRYSRACSEGDSRACGGEQGSQQRGSQLCCLRTQFLDGTSHSSSRARRPNCH